MVRTYIGIGSNLNEPDQQVKAAIISLNQIFDSDVSYSSSLYRSKPLGVNNQPDFFNAVVAMDTALNPHQLLACLQKIEHDQGRVRDGTHWEPRIIDLDLLLYGGEIISTDDLVVPHPGIAQREFVIYPLVEIAPHLVLPNGVPIHMLKAGCSPRGIIRVLQDGQ